MKKLRLKREREEKTVREIFEAYQRHNKILNLAEQTLIHKRENMKRFLDFLGDETFLMKDVDKELVEDFTLYLMKDNLKPVTINTYLRNIRAFINWAADNNYLEKFEIVMPKLEEELKETYSEEQLELLLKKPDMKTCSFTEYRSWVVVNYLLATGNRLNTVINLKIRDIDLDNRLLNLTTMKNKKQQIVPASDVLVEVLSEYLTYRDGKEDDYLFVTVYNKKMSRLTLEKSIATYNRNRGVNITSIHIFRHTYAKMYIKNGGDAFSLQRLLNHADIKMTKRYVSMFATDLQINYDKLNPLDTFIRKNKKEYIKMRK